MIYFYIHIYMSAARIISEAHHPMHRRLHGLIGIGARSLHKRTVQDVVLVRPPGDTLAGADREYATATHGTNHDLAYRWLINFIGDTPLHIIRSHNPHHIHFIIKPLLCM